MAPLFDSGDSGLDTLVEIQYNGHVRLSLPAVLSISCIMDMRMYPFDTQRCYLKIGGWTN